MKIKIPSWTAFKTILISFLLQAGLSVGLRLMADDEVPQLHFEADSTGNIIVKELLGDGEIKQNNRGVILYNGDSAVTIAQPDQLGESGQEGNSSALPSSACSPC